MLLVYLVKYQVNERFRHKMFMPIPIELITVIIGIIVSYIVDFNGRWNVSIINDIPMGYN